MAPIRRNGDWYHWEGTQWTTWNNPHWVCTEAPPPPRFAVSSMGPMLTIYLVGLLAVLVAVFLTLLFVSQDPKLVTAVVGAVTGVIGAITGHAAGHAAARRH